MEENALDCFNVCVKKFRFTDSNAKNCGCKIAQQETDRMLGGRWVLVGSEVPCTCENGSFYTCVWKSHVTHG